VSLVRARLAVAFAGRRPLVPLTALVFAVIGVFAYPRNDVGGSWAVTSVLGFGLAAWLVAAVERGIPDATEAMLAVAAGGPRAAWRARVALVGAAAALVAVVFIAYPLLLGSFARAPSSGQVAAAALLHLVCAAAGGALALALAPPVRLATAFAGILAALLATVAASGALGAVAGPGGAAQAFSDSSGDLSAGLWLALAVTVLEALILAELGRLAARRRG
jgi:hypothetical protein